MTAQDNGFRFPLFVKGDFDGFIGLFIDNLVNLLLITGLCAGMLGMPGEIVFGRILPGVALSVHPSGEEELLAPTIEVLRRAGADLDRTIICHVDLMGFSQDAVRMVADAGCYVAFDNFGVEGTFRHPSSGRLVELADGERIEEVVRLVRDGYLERILVSHDIATKDRLSRFGGHGYSHILMRIVPQLVAAGVSSREVEALLRGNPQRVLCGAES